jgi:plasmid segregation protein ParM
MSTVIAIDHGNSAVKTASHQFVSGLSDHLARPPLADELIEFEGKYWTLSSNRIAYKRDKTKDDRFFILSLFAIAQELKIRGELASLHSIVLAVGLPPEHYGQGREGFADYFKRPGVIKFVYNDTPLSVLVEKVFVYPQAYAAVVPQAERLRGADRLFVIDIGGMTTDVLLLRNGKPDLQICRSLETGIITMQNEIIGKINALYDMTIEDDHIAAVLQGRDTILPEDVKETTRTACRQHAENILDKLRELKVDLRSNPAVFIGGGSVLLKPYIEQSKLVAHAEFIPQVNANAVGYQMLAASQLKRAAPGSPANPQIRGGGF